MKKYYLIGISSVALIFTSCLKDKKVDDKVYGMNGVEDGKIIEFPAPETHGIAFALDFKNLDTTFQFLEVRLAAAEPATEDLPITLSLANSTGLVADFNTANGTSLVDFPVSLYSLPDGLNVTIAKGSRSAFLRIKLNAGNFNPSSTYALGFKVANIGKTGYTISGNYGEVVVSFGAKNKFDGVYELRGFHNRPGLDAPYDEEVEMITSGPNSVYMNWAVAGLVTHPLNGGTGYYSGFTTNFIFDPATNKMIGWDMTPYPLSVTPSMGPATDSRWDPSSKTIYAQYYYNANPTQRGFTDTLFYLRPR